MSTINPFIHENSAYKTKMDPINGYINKATLYLMKQYNLDIESAKSAVKEIIKNSDIKDPIVEMYERDLYTEEKHKKEITLSNYINDIFNKDFTIAPSFTAYYKKMPNEYNEIVDFESIDASWTRINAAKRKEYKNKMKEYKAKGDILNMEINNILQKAMKIKNNSLSGVYSLKHLPISTFSAHYGLTSNTRMVSGIGNMISERIVAGNRFYRKRNDVMAEFLSILEAIDRNKIKDAMEFYNLKYPTVKDIIIMVLESSHWYWKDEEYIKFIEKFLNKLTDVELAGLLFTHDIFSMTRLNKEFIYKMINDLGTPKTGISDDITLLKDAPMFMLNLVHHACEMELRGKGLDYSKLPKNIQDMLVSTYLNIKEKFKYYDKYIDAFFRSVFLNPINIGSLKEMVRKKIVLSDTDSTCATYFSNLGVKRFDIKKGHVGMSAVLMVFVSETANHLLKILSANLNAKPENWDKLEMKPEYTWTAFIPSNVSKHYINGSIIEELIVLPKTNISTSGVNLIAGNIPKDYKAKQMEMIEEVIEAIYRGEPIDEYEFLNKLINIEISIIETIKENPSKILKFEKIKPESAYSEPWNKSNYFHYKLYKEVFANKYGHIDEPPIAALKLPIKIDRVSKLIEWIEDNIKDIEMKNNFIKILKESKKQSMGNIKIPHAIASSKGVMEELIPLINYRQLLMDIMRPFYIALESFGIYLREDRLLLEEWNNMVDVEEYIKLLNS